MTTGAITALWPMIKWALQALGLMGTDDRELERNYKLRLLEAAEKKDAALIEAWARFQAAQTTFERVYRTVVGSLLFYDVAFGSGRSIVRARELTEAGFAGLFVLSILLFPFYGAALVSGVATAFNNAVQGVVEVIASRRAVSTETTTTTTKETTTKEDPEPTRPDEENRGDDRPGKDRL